MALDREIRNGAAYVATYLIILAVLMALRRPCAGKPRLLRHLAHVLVTLPNIPAPFLLQSPWTMLILELIFLICLYLIRAHSLLRPIFAAQRRSYGDLILPVTFLLLFLLARHRIRIYVAALLVLAFSDPLASAVGGSYGTPSSSPFGGRKSLPGAAAFFLSSFLIILTILGTRPTPLWKRLLWQALVTSLSAAGLEYCSPLGADNLVVPTAVLYGLILSERLYRFPAPRVLLPVALMAALSLLFVFASRRKVTDDPAGP